MILTTPETEGVLSTDEATGCRENSRGILVRTCRRSAGAGFHQHRLGDATLCVGIQRMVCDAFWGNFQRFTMGSTFGCYYYYYDHSLSVCL